MATVIGDLAVRVGADTTGLTKGMVRAKSSLNQFNKDVKSGAATLGKLTAAVGAAGAAVAVFANQSLKATKETANLARLSGASVGDFQKMAFAVRDAGIEQDKLADILKDTQDRVGDFLSTGGGPMADFFENIAPKVGVTAEQFRKLSGPDALQLYVSSLEKANLSQSDMTFYMEAMASDATALLPLLKDGGKAMLEQAKQAERLGIALSDMDVAQMEIAAESMDDIGRIMSGFRDQVTAEISPLISALGRQFIGLTEDAGGVDTVVTNSFNNVIDAIANTMNAFDRMNRVFLKSQTAVDIFAVNMRIGLLEIAREIVEIPTAAINELIMAFNNIPGVDMDLLGMGELGQGLTKVIDSSKQEIAGLNAELNKELGKPLAGNQLQKFYAEAVQTAKDSAAQRLEVEKESNNKEVAAQQTAHNRMIEQRRNFREMEMALDQEYRGIEKDVEQHAQEEKFKRLQNYMQQELNIQRSGFDGLVNLAKDTWGAEEGIMVDALGSMVNSLSTESKKMFEIQKAAGIANAIVSTYTAASKALEAGPFLGPVLAAAITASGFAKVQAIRSQSFGGGGSAAGGGAGAGQGQVDAAAQQQESRRSVNIDIGLTGADSRDRAVAGSVISQINEEVERGERINRIALA